MSAGLGKHPAHPWHGLRAASGEMWPRIVERESATKALSKQALGPGVHEPANVTGHDSSRGVDDTSDCKRCVSAGSIEFEICQVCLCEALPALAFVGGRALGSDRHTHRGTLRPRKSVLIGSERRVDVEV